MEKPAKLRGHLFYLRDCGGDPDKVLAGTGVTLEQIAALMPLPRETIAVLFDVLANRTPDDFAIQCGRATRPQYMGMLGYRLLNCATVRDLLATWCRYSIVIGYPLETRLLVEGNCWRLEFRPRFPMTPRALRFCMETTIAGSLPALRSLSGHDVQPLSYAFPFPAPDNLACYGPLGEFPIAFDADAGVITGRRIDIDLRLVAVDEEAKSLCDAYCRQALVRIGQAETTCERLLAMFAASPGHLPSARDAATSLGLSLRTFQRHLIDEGSSFHLLVDQFRQDQACTLLKEGMQAKAIAHVLGFQNVGSFRRAFRNWTGEPPGRWRQSPPGQLGSVTMTSGPHRVAPFQLRDGASFVGGSSLVRQPGRR